MNKIFEILHDRYPEATCELNYDNLYQLTIAVILSSQTTDKKVNTITPILFSKYKDFVSLQNANQSEVEKILNPLGLYKNKAKNIIALSNKILKDFNGILPSNKEDLITLPGIGNKSAALILLQGFNIPAFPVDTHVARVTKRLRLADIQDTPDQISNKLKKLYPNNLWGQLHHLFIFHGRYCCHSKKPECLNCPLKEFCHYN